jgi:hypothetical protein
MHGFNNAGYFLFLAFISVVSSMSFWFRDVISEGRIINTLKSVFIKFKLYITKSISKEDIRKIKEKSQNIHISQEQLGFYLAGLLEGDGHISLPFLGNTILNRILNPRIIFTSHINDLWLYVYIQSMLGGIGRFQQVDNNIIRYIIGDKEGILHLIRIIHGKLRTPKNQSFNELIIFFNKKYNLNISESTLDKSDLFSNSWFAGFVEADGHFGVKIVEPKSKSITRKRSVSYNISLKFRLDQRFFDKKTSLSMLEIMEKIAQFLSCKLTTYQKKDNTKILSISVVAKDKIKFIIEYFNKHTLLGIKYINFKDWEVVYNMIICNKHLTEQGRSEIKLIQSNMNSKRIHGKSYLELHNNNIKSDISLYFIILFIILIGYQIFIYDFNTNYLICMAADSDNSIIKGGLEAKNVKITGLDVAVEQIRDGAVYIAGMTAAAKVVKSSSLPIGAKLGATVGMGAASLVSYKMVQNNLSSTRSHKTITAEAEKVNSSVGISESNYNDPYISKSAIDYLESNGGNSDNNFIISSLDVEQLQLDFYLHLIIIYLLIILFVFLIMKNFGEHVPKFEFINKLPWGNHIQILLIKIIKWWSKTNILWIYVILVNILICMIISAWSIFIILNNIR